MVIEMSNIDKLEEWGEWAKNRFTKPPTRRVGKRLIQCGEIPGEIIDGKPWVYAYRYDLRLSSPSDSKSLDQQALELLGV